MEMETLNSTNINEKDVDIDDVPLPGFRFHPTDEELVGFYLRRKVEKRAISIQLIKQADIYKYDPWDLPKSSTVGDNEWYFFCKRGRKYKNSIRPNRVTGSGFWKATGIDRPIYSSGGEGRDCIGLKKSLVFYRGSAGKGTKTDWMMHEFRLPSDHGKSTNHMNANTIAQGAEVWTLCRILKRNVSSCIPDWREMTGKRSIINPVIDHANINTNTNTCSVESSNQNNPTNYISFSAPIIRQNADQTKPYSAHIENIANQQFLGHFYPSSLISQAPPTAASSSFTSSMSCLDINELLKYADWEDLQSIVDSSATRAVTN